MAWDVSTPDGGDPVSTVDDTIRADKLTLQTALGEEHDFIPSSTTGKHKEGSAKIYVVASTLPTESKDIEEGRVGLITGSNTLYYADGSAWKLLAPARNHAMWSRSIGPGDIWCTATDWAVISPNGWQFEQTITTSGGHIRMVCTLTGWAESDSIYFNFKLDDGGPVTSMPNGLAHVRAHPSAVSRDTVTMHWATSVTNGVDPVPDPPTAGEHTIKVLWKKGGSGTGGLCGNFSHHTYVEEI
jgi:hypothetical protein